MDLLKIEGKVNRLEKELDRIAQLRLRASTLNSEIAKLEVVHTDLMNSTKTLYVKKALKAPRRG